MNFKVREQRTCRYKLFRIKTATFPLENVSFWTRLFWTITLPQIQCFSGALNFFFFGHLQKTSTFQI